MNRNHTGAYAALLILLSLACICASPLGSTTLAVGLVVALLAVGFLLAVVE